jgi:hypothetical protein
MVGIFRDINIKEHMVTYIELNADSTAKLKRVFLADSLAGNKVFIENGHWKTVNDTVVLTFEPTYQSSHLQVDSENQLLFLIKSQNELYTYRNTNGEFVKDNLVMGRKAKKIVRLPKQLEYEYYNLKD